MPTASSPVWNAAQSGIVGNAGAIAASAQVNQLLTTHPDTTLYQGHQIVTPLYVYAATANPWNTPLATTDVDQPFTMSGTVIGRVQIPVLAVGDGADLLVSLCADNSGTPGTMICQTRIPASWITQLGAVSGAAAPATQAPVTQLTGNALAVPQHQIWGFSDQVIQPYNYPALTFTGISASPSSAFYGGYIVIIGGVTGGNALTGVYTMQFTAARELLPTLPQPTFPAPNDGSSATCIVLDSQDGAPVVVNSGGGTSFEGAPVATVYTSSLDTSAGTLSAWSAQTAVPTAIQNHALAAGPNGYVYSIGGRNTAGTVLNTVNIAQVANGQITGWTATTPLPIPVQLPFAAVSNGFLIVAGGADASFTGIPNVYYAAINETAGTIGPWIPGPPLSTGAYSASSSAFANAQGVLMDTNANTLTVGPSGPSSTWSQDLDGGGGELPGWWDLGNGSLIAYALAPSENLVGVAYDNLMPYLSVPLPATGLTNGATYHVLLQQHGGDLTDYLVTCIGPGIFSASGPTAMTSPAAAYTWTAEATGSAVPFAVFDQTVPYTGAKPWHTWEDQGAKIATLVYATTPDQRFLGICEATRMGLAINANQGFEAGLAPWTVSGGTYDQSTAQSYAGLHSALITPSGSAASVSIASEIMPCMPGQSITVEGWFWFTNAVTATFSHSVVWYPTPTGGTPVSTSSSLVSVSAGTWTQEGGALTAPAGAYGFAMEPTLSGTPAASQLWYADDVIATCTYVGPQQSTVTAIEWSGTGWPSVGVPLGATELA